MAEKHPNLAILAKLDIRDLDVSAPLFSEDFVWHYFNPNFPELEGDYLGFEGLRKFFALLSAKSEGTFSVEPVSTAPVGNELIVVHARNILQLKNNMIAIDAVVVWRIVDGKIREAWDIPSAFTLAHSE